MHASDVWIEKLTMFNCSSHCIVDPLSSKDAAIVVDLHWFTDCHLEVIFDMNNYHHRRERCSSDHERSSLNPVQRDILPHRHFCLI